MSTLMTDEQVEQKYADEFYVADNSGGVMQDDVLGAPSEYATLELTKYIVWLGANAVEVEPRKLAVLALACIKRGMWWGEVADDLGLPIPGEWES